MVSVAYYYFTKLIITRKNLILYQKNKSEKQN